MEKLEALKKLREDLERRFGGKVLERKRKALYDRIILEVRVAEKLDKVSPDIVFRVLTCYFEGGFQ